MQLWGTQKAVQSSRWTGAVFLLLFASVVSGRTPLRSLEDAGGRAGAFALRILSSFSLRKDNTQVWRKRVLTNELAARLA